MVLLYGLYVIINLVAYIWTLIPIRLVNGGDSQGVCYLLTNNRLADDIIWSILELFFDFSV